MPLNGGGTASKPSGTTFVPNTTIASSPMNSVIDDIYAIFNTPRPIVYGGTNGASAVEGGDNLSTKGADIPSAATTDIGASTGRFIHITGTTTITGLGTKTAGVVRFVVFDGILTLTHNATSLILPGATSIATAAGDTAIFISEGSGNWRCVDYVRASGLPVVNTTGLQGYVFGLNATTNTGTPASNIDISVGVSAKFDSPYTLITLASAITKNAANAWAVGTGNGSLDTGAIANSTYYGYLIQRSDTGVVDVLTSLSATSPTMPASYDRRSPALFSFVRTASVNSAPTMLNAPSKKFVSALQTITSAGLLTLPHGLAVIPDFVQGELVCLTADIGYAIGDIVVVNPAGNGYASGGSAAQGVVFRKDATNIYVRYGSGTNPFQLMNGTTGVVANMTNANWNFRVRAIG